MTIHKMHLLVAQDSIVAYKLRKKQTNINSLFSYMSRKNKKT